MKVFRWSGLIGFVAVLALLLVIGFFFIDNWIKAGIEAGGTRINGAEVNVGDVDLTFSPIGFKLENLRITDVDEPTKNLFELDEARLQLRLAPLFFGRINIEAMIVDGMRSGTERRRPGRVLRQAEATNTDSSNSTNNTDTTAAAAPATADAGGASPASSRTNAGGETASVANASSGSSLPDPTQVALSNLEQTRTAVSRAQTQMQTASDNVSSALDALPDDASLDDYDRRLDALGERRLDSIEAVRRTRDDLNALAEQAARDQLSVANARQAARDAVQTAEDALADVSAAPARDWSALKEKYPLNAATATRFGRMLLGDEIFDQVEQIQDWYEQASPWLARLAPEPNEDGPQRLDGRYVRFPHPNPAPDFMLREALIGFEADGQPWRIQLLDVTGQQSMTGRPVRIEIVKGDLDDPRLRIAGVLDRRGDSVHDRFELFGRDLGLGDRRVAVADAQLDWVPGRTDLSGTVDVIDGELDGNLALRFSDSNFAAGGNSRTTALLNQALGSVSSFDMGIAIDGTVRRPQLSLTSDLDNQLNQALSRVVREEYDRWLAQSRASIDAEAAQLRAPLDERLAEVRAERDRVQAQADEFQAEVTDRIESERDRLQQRLRRLESQAEDAIKDQIKKLDLPF
ncbi:TIGR03545 family protein [Saccharospirillum sp. HFRX-1]|uniref:TIGR03545 family protein n=1 Tax=unclassified Saccharospirillum TaxID=2633430 RepID=UPI0037219887